MYDTARPRNHCNTCGYSWQPRGHNISKCCPSPGCKSSNVYIPCRLCDKPTNNEVSIDNLCNSCEKNIAAEKELYDK